MAEEAVGIECGRGGIDGGVVGEGGGGEGKARVGREAEAVFEGVGFRGAALDGDCDAIQCT